MFFSRKGTKENTPLLSFEVKIFPLIFKRADFQSSLLNQTKNMKTLNQENSAQTLNPSDTDELVGNTYELIVAKAIGLLKDQTTTELKSYCTMDHFKNELNSTLINEFLCYFWNITLSKDINDGGYCIDVDFGKEALVKFGNSLANSLIQEIFNVLHANVESAQPAFPLFINFVPIEHLTYWYRTIAQGETEYVSIFTSEG